MVRRKEKSELEQAEIKLESLIQRRDALNAQAAVSREERDLLHQQKREVVDRARALRDERDRLVDEMRAHRGRRDEVQRKGRGPVELKGEGRGQVQGGISGGPDRLPRGGEGMGVGRRTTGPESEEGRRA